MTVGGFFRVQFAVVKWVHQRRMITGHQVPVASMPETSQRTAYS